MVHARLNSHIYSMVHPMLNTFVQINQLVFRSILAVVLRQLQIDIVEWAYTQFKSLVMCGCELR